MRSSSTPPHRSLADERRLLQRNEDGAHPRDVLRLPAGFGVEVTEVGDPAPLGPRAVGAAVLGQGVLLRRSAAGER